MVIFCLISGIINFLTTALLGIFILIKSYRVDINRYFVYSCLAVAFWSFFYFMWLATPNPIMAEFYLRTCMIGAFFIPATFFHFIARLLNYKKLFWFIIFNYVFSFTATLFVYTPLYAHSMSRFMGFWWLRPGPFFHIIILHFALVIIYALWCLYQTYRITKEKKFKEQTKLLLIALLIGFISGSTNYLMWYRIPIAPVANILVAVYVFIIAYAIFKYEFLDVKVIIKNSLIYSSLVTIITLTFLISVLISEHLFHHFIHYQNVASSVITASLIALIFIPLKNLIQNFVEKTLFRGSYIHIAEENDLLRQEIIQTEKLKSIATLASGMAHEIKNPLTVIRTFSEYLPHKIDDKGFLKKFSPMIAQEVKRIDNLVHELLDFAKPADPLLKPVNIHELIHSTLELLSNECIKYNVKIHQDSRLSSDVLLPLDYNQIKQALLNIFLNAIEAMRNGGQLNVSTYPSTDGERIHIKIQDTGIGIDSEDLPHIFDPFFSKKDSGTGLGLSITHEIIKKHGGKIFVERGRGTGATRVIELPVSL